MGGGIFSEVVLRHIWRVQPLNQKFFLENDTFKIYNFTDNTITPYITKKKMDYFKVFPENTNLRGSIILQLTSCLFCLDSSALLMLH